MESKMAYEEFKPVIKGELVKRFPGWKVVLWQRVGVNGSNGDVLTLIIGNGSMLPTMTVRNLYESYLADSMEAAIERFEELALRGLCMPRAKELERDMASYKWAKSRLMFALYHFMDNQEYFADMVHYRWLDLMLVLGVDFGKENCTSFVKRSRQKQWDVRDETLYQDAMDNMQKEDWGLIGLSEMIQELSGERLVVQNGEEDDYYVLIGNRNRFNTAAIAIPGVLQQVAKKLGTETLLIFPCSIHDVLVKPVEEKPKKQEVAELRNMVQEINVTIVDEECRLSDNVYIYYAGMDRVMIL